MGTRSDRAVRETERAPRAARILGAALACVSLFMSEAGAVVAKPLSLDELVATSDHVVVATIVSSEGRWNEERTRIYTYTTIKVEERIKGSGRGETMVIQTLGGSADGMGLHIEGAPQFREGEREVLFLASVPGSRNLIVQGWNQGRFLLRPDPRTGEETLVRSLAGVVFAEPPPEGVAAEFRALRTLDDLRHAVQSRVREEE